MSVYMYVCLYTSSHKCTPNLSYIYLQLLTKSSSFTLTYTDIYMYIHGLPRTFSSQTRAEAAVQSVRNRCTVKTPRHEYINKLRRCNFPTILYCDTKRKKQDSFMFWSHLPLGKSPCCVGFKTVLDVLVVKRKTPSILLEIFLQLHYFLNYQPKVLWISNRELSLCKILCYSKLRE